MSSSAHSPDGESAQSNVQSETPDPRQSITTTSRTPTAPNSQPVNDGTRRQPYEPDNNSSACSLPVEKVFPIQIGTEVFRLSGASIGSDGYYIKPRDGGHFVKLYADAQFYSLPKLISQLFESEIFIEIGDRDFRIPRDIFNNPGDSPNFFSLGFAVFFSSPGEAFPGLDRRGLLRPPTIVPPSVPNRSAETFSQLLHLLRGYPIHIRDEKHRQELLRDCRYFHLRGLEQRLVACDVAYNLHRQRSEISIRLEDVKPSGVSTAIDTGQSNNKILVGYVNYSRPFIDEKAYELIVEIGDESIIMDTRSMQATLYGTTKARIASLAQVLMEKWNLRINRKDLNVNNPGNGLLRGDTVRVVIDPTTHVVLDNDVFDIDSAAGDTSYSIGAALPDNLDTRQSAGPNTSLPPPTAQKSSNTSLIGKRPSSPSPGLSANKRRKQDNGAHSAATRWVVRRGQWRLCIQHDITEGRQRPEMVFIAIKLDVFTSERSRNASRRFIG